MPNNSFPKWLAVTFLLVNVVVVTAGAWFHQTQEKQLLLEAQAELQAVAHLKVNQISAWRNERLADAYVLMESPFLGKQVCQFLASPHAKNTKDMLTRFRSLQKHYKYFNVLLVDAAGRTRLGLQSHNYPLCPFSAQSFAKALRERCPELTDIFTDIHQPQIRIDVIVPFFARNGTSDKPIGAIVLQIDVQDFLYPVIESWPSSSRSAESLLVREDGDSVLFLNRLRYQRNSALKLRIPLSRTDVPAVMAVTGVQGVVQGKDYRGVEVLSALQAIPETPWFLVAKEDTNEVLGAWHSLSALILGATLLLMLLASVVTGLIWQQNNNAHYRSLKRTHEMLLENEENLSITLNSIGDAVISTDTCGRIVRMNPVAEQLTGWVISEAIGRPVSDVIEIVNALTDEPAFLPVDSALANGEVYHLDEHTTLISRDGVRRQIADSAAPIRNCLGIITGAVMVFSDVTEQYRAREAVQTEKENLAAIFASSPVGMLLLDAETMIVNTNSVIAGMVSRNADEIISLRLGNGLGCVHSAENSMGCGFAQACIACSLNQGISQTVKTGQALRGAEIKTTLIIDGKESSSWLRISAEPVIINGRDQVIVAVDDITDRKQAQEALAQAKAETELLNQQLEKALLDSHEYAVSLEIAKIEIEEHAVELSQQATHDALTGLPNRKYFEHRLNELVTCDESKQASPFCVLFLDLDKFKLINDTMGHKVGDLLLVDVAERLQSCIRSEDVLARMGGDEFTVLLTTDHRPSDIESVATRMIDSISRPFEIQGRRFVIGASIGLACYPSDGKDTVSLLKHADAAMYKAKQSGRGTYCWYSGDVDVENQQRSEMEMDIRTALEKGQFEVYYQPIVDLEDANIIAAEALLRWEHPNKGMISPSLFIPIAEEIGLIGPIGEYVLRTACAQTMAWRDEGIHLSQISVNVSTRQIHDAGWLDSVSAALSDTGLDAQYLNLEVTETDFSSDYESMNETLRQVQEMGICMAIDDFGMGQSSLSRLKDFPVIHLKIDGSFVRDIEHNKNDNALVRSIVELAHGQEIKVTAEWVETQSQMDILRSIGCNYAQGYFISPALPAETFGDFIRQWTLPQRELDAA